MIGFDLVDGRVRLAVDGAEAALLGRLVDQFTTLLGDVDAAEEPADPALRRLLPDPVPGDPAESAEARRLTGPGLVEHKRTNAARVAASLAEPGDLDAGAELAWLQWLTDIRLVLATRLGIVLDGDEGASGSEEQRAMLGVYHALGALQGELLDAIDDRPAA